MLEREEMTPVVTITIGHTTTGSVTLGVDMADQTKTFADLSGTDVGDVLNMLLGAIAENGHFDRVLGGNADGEVEDVTDVFTRGVNG